MGKNLYISYGLYYVSIYLFSYSPVVNRII